MPLQLEIVSPERRAYSDEVDMVTVPGIDGELGILPHHTRLISALGTGELRIKKAGVEQALFISGGFVEVRADKVIVMADLAEHTDEIDEAKAVEARRKAEAELGDVHDPIDLARVRAALIARDPMGPSSQPGDLTPVCAVSDLCPSAACRPSPYAPAYGRVRCPAREQ